ncbi:hypothetical protein O0I10_007011 [Lichtheimia ornata]|uniref:Uncharacterized protein n=1 Tax=Lichtheimia ornata TaxID=688661 RepID=A0AAD7V2T1_9FUNG|nr:uncharacterized protein O0I10_007011 [Lichtheimia ornata]KAJ8657195.1 hypothetical protein O0I10_007011 [Lichtheimia ornata]
MARVGWLYNGASLQLYLSNKYTRSTLDTTSIYTTRTSKRCTCFILAVLSYEYITSATNNNAICLFGAIKIYLSLKAFVVKYHSLPLAIDWETAAAHTRSDEYQVICSNNGIGNT